MPAKVYDTDVLAITRGVAKEIGYRIIEKTDSGCWHYDPQFGFNFLIERRGTHPPKSAQVSVIRLVWAWAHPEDHLGVHEIAAHTCLTVGPTVGSFRSRNFTTHPVCINPDHLVKAVRGLQPSKRIILGNPAEVMV